MELGPILKSMRKNRIGVFLIALQIAVTFAVVLNCLNLALAHRRLLDEPTGYDEDNLIVVSAEHYDKSLDDPAFTKSIIERDLRWLRGLESVKAATVVNNIPLSDSGSSERMFPEGHRERETAACRFFGDEDVLQAYGLELAAGRSFTAKEVDDEAPVVMISQELADAYFPEGGALGATLHNDLGPGPRVIGIVKLMHGAWRFWSNFKRNIILPSRTYTAWEQVRYMVRAVPGARDALMPLIEGQMNGIYQQRNIAVRTLEDIKANSFRSSFASARVMVTISMILVIVTSLGIAGLTSFWVTQRTRNIGIRRALGASKVDILRYFMLENVLITALGLMLGLGFAYLLNRQLIAATPVMPVLPWSFLPIGMVGLWFLGLVSVFFPARRASLIHPAIATRA